MEDTKGAKVKSRKIKRDAPSHQKPFLSLDWRPLTLALMPDARL